MIGFLHQHSNTWPNLAILWEKKKKSQSAFKDFKYQNPQCIFSDFEFKKPYILFPF